MCGKGSTTSSSTITPPPIAMGAYQNVLNRAQQAARAPFVPYTGEFTAPINQQQQLGIGNINQYAGWAQPYMTQALGQAVAGSTPLTSADINKYYDPYNQQVVQATQKLFNQQNQMQEQNLRGNAISQGALGGDREKIAEAVLAGQQQLSQAPTIAGLEATGYNDAVKLAMQQQQMQLQGAYGIGSLANAGQNAALQGAGAQFGAGTAEQQTQQAQDTALYQQFLAQQAYPFQTAQYLAGITGAMAPGYGSTTTTQPPQPNQWSQYAGLALAGLALLNKGGRVRGYDVGGQVPGFGPMPYAGGRTYVPQVDLKPVQLAHPQTQSQQPTQQFDPMKFGQQVGNAYQGVSGLGLGIGGENNSLFAYGENGMPIMASEYELGARAGGRVRGYDDGGPVQAGFGTGSLVDDFDNRYDAAFPKYAADVQPVDNSGGITGGLGYQINYPEDADAERMGNYNAGVEMLKRQSAPLPPDQPMDVPGRGFADLPGADRAALAAAKYQPGAQREGADPETIAMLTQPQGGFAPGQELGEKPSAQRSGLLGGLFNLSPEARQGLIAAGLGMAASRSPYFLSGIGEGGLKGVEAYHAAVSQKQKQQAIDEGVKRLDAQLAHQQMMERQGQTRLGIEQQKLDLAQSLPKTINDPILGPRTIMMSPDGKGWVYTDTGERVSAPTAGTPQTTAAPTNPANPDRPYQGTQASPQTMMQATRANLHGQAFLDAVPEGLKNKLEAIANYEAPLSIFSTMGRAGMSRDKALEFVRQINPDYDPNWYSLRLTGLKNFYASTAPNSPVVQARAYNTAVGHAGDLAEAFDELHRIDPGGFTGALAAAREKNIPILSAFAAMAEQKMATGTATGTPWAKIAAVAPLYAAETTKFYSGAAGSQEERNAIQAPFNPKLSFPETMAAMKAQAHMFQSKTAPMEQEFRDIMDAPGLKEYGTSRHYKEWVATKENATKALARIDELAGGAAGAGAGKPKTVYQNGHTYTLQPDGSYK